jgi:hypothetical protein
VQEERRKLTEDLLLLGSEKSRKLAALSQPESEAHQQITELDKGLQEMRAALDRHRNAVHEAGKRISYAERKKVEAEITAIEESLAGIGAAAAEELGELVTAAIIGGTIKSMYYDEQMARQLTASLCH